MQQSSVLEIGIHFTVCRHFSMSHSIALPHLAKPKQKTGRRKGPDFSSHSTLSPMLFESRGEAMSYIFPVRGFMMLNGSKT